MMMVATIIMVWTRATQAEMRLIEHAFELRASQVALPAHGNAPVTIRTCPDCSARVLRVDGNTRYFASFANRVPLNHRAFMEQIAANFTDDTAVYIFYLADSDVVTRIVAGRSRDDD